MNGTTKKREKGKNCSRGGQAMKHKKSDRVVIFGLKIVTKDGKGFMDSIRKLCAEYSTGEKNWGIEYTVNDVYDFVKGGE